MEPPVLETTLRTNSGIPSLTKPTIDRFAGDISANPGIYLQHSFGVPGRGFP